MRTRHRLCCASCTRKPLLAYYGRDEKGFLYVHVKVFKQNRIFGEAVHRGGTVSLRCRECLRWTNVRIDEGKESVSRPTSRPPSVITEPPESVIALARDAK